MRQVQLIVIYYNLYRYCLYQRMPSTLAHRRLPGKKRTALNCNKSGLITSTKQMPPDNLNSAASLGDKLKESRLTYGIHREANR
jgi:hypothetical protein